MTRFEEKLPIGFQLLNPLEHCECCGKKFTQADLDAFRGVDPCMPEELIAAFDPDEYTDFPEICEDCAELQVRAERAERAAGWSASP